MPRQLNCRAIIANKDGWVDFNPGSLPDDEVLTDISGGLKYAT